MSLCVEGVDHCHAALVSVNRAVHREEHIDHRAGFIFAEVARSEREHIRIVVLACVVGGLDVEGHAGVSDARREVRAGGLAEERRRSAGGPAGR